MPETEIQQAERIFRECGEDATAEELRGLYKAAGMFDRFDPDFVREQFELMHTKALVRRMKTLVIDKDTGDVYTMRKTQSVKRWNEKEGKVLCYYKSLRAMSNKEIKALAGTKYQMELTYRREGDMLIEIASGQYILFPFLDPKVL